MIGYSGFCSTCWPQIDFITPPWCISCGSPFEYETQGEDNKKCINCLGSPPSHDGIRAAVVYGDIARNIILKLKYGGRIAIAALAASHLKRFLNDDLELCDTVPWVVPVPLHWSRLLKRTYNQSAFIADELVKDTKLIHVPDTLKRVKRTPPLKGGSLKQRKEILNGAFVLNSKYSTDIQGRDIILLDDVYTSGATTDACVDILKDAGANKVIIYCWARVIGN